MKKLLSATLLAISTSCVPTAYAYTEQQCDEMVRMSNELIVHQAKHENLWDTMVNFDGLDMENNPLHTTLVENFTIYYIVAGADPYYIQFFPDVIREWCTNDPEVNWYVEFEKWLEAQ